MTGTKTNERPGTRAVARNIRMSATKARVVLDLSRNKSVDEAQAILAYTEREAAAVVSKLLDSAVANAAHNDDIDPEVLFVSACYADEGRTLYRFRPRARGRATRIRKRTTHITLIVSPMSGEMLAIEQAKREAIPGSRAARRRGQEAASRSARVAASQAADDDVDTDDEIVDDVAEETTDAVEVADEQADATSDAGADDASEAEAADDTVAESADETDADEAPETDAAADSETDEGSN